MKFLVMTLISNGPDPVTGRTPSPHERFRRVVDNAVLAEELGLRRVRRRRAPRAAVHLLVAAGGALPHRGADRRGSGCSPRSPRCRLLDPVRAFEDYATLDHLSDGRLELIIGKGNGAAQARAVPRHRRGPVGPQPRGLRAVPPALAGGPGHLVGPVPAVADRAPRRGRGRCSSRSGSGTAARPARTPSSSPRATATRCSRPTSPTRSSPTPSWSGTTGSGGRTTATTRPTRWSAPAPPGFHVARTSQEALEAYRPIFERRLRAVQRRLGLPVGVPDARGLRRAQLGAGRQPAADRSTRCCRYHERARPRGHPPARRRRRPDRRPAPRTRSSCSRSEVAPVLRRRVPSRPLAGPMLTGPPSTPVRIGAVGMGAHDPPAVDPRPVPDPAGRHRGAGAAQHHRPRPARRAGRLPPLLGRRAPPHPRRRRRRRRPPARPDRRGHQHDPGRVRARCRPATAPPLSMVEQFGMLDALHPGRIDLGLGRSGGTAGRCRTAPARRTADRRHGTGRRRAAHPAAVRLRGAARLAALRAPARAAAASPRRQSAGLRPSRSTTSSP